MSASMPGSVAPKRQGFWDWRAACNFIFGGAGAGTLVYAAAMPSPRPPRLESFFVHAGGSRQQSGISHTVARCPGPGEVPLHGRGVRLLEVLQASAE